MITTKIVIEIRVEYSKLDSIEVGIIQIDKVRGIRILKTIQIVIIADYEYCF